MNGERFTKTQTNAVLAGLRMLQCYIDGERAGGFDLERMSAAADLFLTQTKHRHGIDALGDRVNDANTVLVLEQVPVPGEGWWTVIGEWPDGEVGPFIEPVVAKNPYEACAKMRSKHGSDLTITSVHPGKLRTSVADRVWTDVNEMGVCLDADCKALFTGGDGYNGYCPGCSDKRETEGVHGD